MSNGDRYERQLVNALGESGDYVAMRCPSSGSATTRDLPDLLALRPEDDPLAIELKTTSATTAYADADEVEALRAFADKAGATALLAAKFKTPGKRTPFYLVPPERCRKTPEGNYGVPESDVVHRSVLAVWAATKTKPARVDTPD